VRLAECPEGRSRPPTVIERLKPTRTGQSPGTVDCPYLTKSRRLRRIIAVDGKGEPVPPGRPIAAA